MDVRVGLWRKLSAEELMLLNCGVGEDSWESLGLQGDQPVHSEGDQPWVFFGRNDAKAETLVLWPPDAKSWLIGKVFDAGRDWEQEKGTTEDEMAGWHHWLNGRESEWTLGVGDGQGGLASCNSWGRKESETTERLNWTEWHNNMGKPERWMVGKYVKVKDSKEYERMIQEAVNNMDALLRRSSLKRINRWKGNEVIILKSEWTKRKISS